VTSGDLLLYVVSAKRDMSWAVFKRTFDILAAKEIAEYESAAIARSVVLKSLDGLGHCEVLNHDGNLRVIAAPSVLVRLPLKNNVAVLAGARSPESLEQVSRVASEFGMRVESTAQYGELSQLVPERVSIVADGESSLAESATKLCVPYSEIPAAWTLSQISATLNDIVGNLNWAEAPELNWPRTDFDPEYNSFKEAGDSRPSFRVTRYLDPTRNIFRYYVWDGALYAPIDPDWGRYMALQRAGFGVLYFDYRLNLLAIPRTVPLPRLLARSASLCSGSIAHPHRSRLGKRYLDFVVYELVPQVVAEVVAAKVGQELIDCHLNIGSGVQLD
jgi:hypothetical protein